MILVGASIRVGGAAAEMAKAQYAVRAAGYLHGGDDLGRLPYRFDGISTRFLKDIADVRTEPPLRQGIADLDGEGEVGGGIVVICSDFTTVGGHSPAGNGREPLA